jgi:hypothetical protein
LASITTSNLNFLLFLKILNKIYSFKDKFDIKIDIRTLRLNDDVCTWTSSNTQTLGELFVGFLEFYSNFEYVVCKFYQVSSGDFVLNASICLFMLFLIIFLVKN